MERSHNLAKELRGRVAAFAATALLGSLVAAGSDGSSAEWDMSQGIRAAVKAGWQRLVSVLENRRFML
jgi:hypothetical protein